MLFFSIIYAWCLTEAPYYPYKLLPRTILLDDRRGVKKNPDARWARMFIILKLNYNLSWLYHLKLSRKTLLNAKSVLVLLYCPIPVQFEL